MKRIVMLFAAAAAFSSCTVFSGDSPKHNAYSLQSNAIEIYDIFVYNPMACMIPLEEVSNYLFSMTEEEQFALLSTDGMLVKRPLIIADNVILTGFRQKDVILGSRDPATGLVSPHQPSFDASAIWGPVIGTRFYVGIRYRLAAGK